MSDLARRLDWAPARLKELLERYNIPGVSLAVWNDGEEYRTAAGLANATAGIEATTDALFLIGSNTKVYTTSLIMQLVERGDVELDEPVKKYVPELELSDPEATETVTVRHLLTHTSGITGDYFPDCGRGDDAVALCVAGLAEVPMLYQPGSMFSYCNSGFILCGRLIERVTGQRWDDVIRSQLLEPIGSHGFATLPEEALLWRVGVGHVPDPETGKQQPGHMWPEVRSGGPAGFTPFATASDLVLFARLHLDGGSATTGATVLSPESVAAMQQQEVYSTPSGSFDSDGWGLGWARFQYSDGERVIGHNGGSSAILRVLPERNFAVASLTNASNGALVGHHIIDAIVDELFSLRIPTAPEPSTSPVELSTYEGVYQHLDMKSTVSVVDGELTVTTSRYQGVPVILEPIGSDRFIGKQAGLDVSPQVSFIGAGGEPPAYLHTGGRAWSRVE